MLGCSEEWRDVSISTTTVNGRITYRGRPISGGWIELLPAEGSLGYLRSSPLDADGRFQIERVSEGVHVVRVVNPPFSLTSVGPVEARSRFETPMSPARVMVREGDELLIELREFEFRTAR